MGRPRKYEGDTKARRLAASRAYNLANKDKIRESNRIHFAKIRRLAALAIAHGLDKEGK